MNKLKMVDPKVNLIEVTAGKLAAEIYESGHSKGYTSRYKDARHYARVNIEKFIPKACEILTEMLGRPDVSEFMKMEIYQALMERANDPDLAEIGKAASLPEFEKTILYRSDDQPKPKPIILNSINPFKPQVQ